MKDMSNHLKEQTSPYLLQHADNPVDWYPWGEAAFEKAKTEEKPIFLSIGYSTCHWCHVMAHESFMDKEVAEILNRYFVSIKVDKEERPDIDSIYMSVCQTFTGSGGWPTTIFMTPDQKPFFAGTYFPKTEKWGQIGFKDLISVIVEKWEADRDELVKSADEIVAFMREQTRQYTEQKSSRLTEERNYHTRLLDTAFSIFQRTFDTQYGGFGDAPKFPTPHNLLFLMKYYEKTKNEEALKMAEKTLMQMYRGGLFDHIGGGFSRYSTDRMFLVPHFEKMLYDNALLILAYSKAYRLTQKSIYGEIVRRTADYILREMTFEEGGFYSAQDADSEGEEGKYYLFNPKEILQILGEEEGREFNRYYEITEAGNFEGKNIPNLLKNNYLDKNYRLEQKALYKYRKQRYQLHLDDKILTSWNGLMIAAMCKAYSILEEPKYLAAAKMTQKFIEENLCKEDVLYVSFRDGKQGQKGFLDDYAFEIFALITLYENTLEDEYLEKAKRYCDKAIRDFYDDENGGFFLYGSENEQLILRPKETYDGAVFSGNSAMAYNLVKLYELSGEYRQMVEGQITFMSKEAAAYPAGYSMFLIALLDYLQPAEKVCHGGICRI